MLTPPTHEDVAAARERIAGRVVRTPTLASARLDEIAGGRVLIKPECLQRTGSFKLRGATNAILQLTGTQRARGVVAYSSGNHAQGVACAAASLSARATIVMPADAPLVKVESTRAWGAEVVFYDRMTEDREAIAADVSARTGAALIPPFEHPHVIAGQGTLALELAEDAGRLDVLLVCVGGGGMVAGCALALEGSGAAIWGVEPEGADDTRRSLAAGERVGNAPGGSQLCDALLSPSPGELTFSINRGRLAGVAVVSDAEVLAAMAFAFRHLKLVVEPGGAVALAAALSGKLDLRGRTAGVVLSGGNVDPAVFSRAIGAGG
jgi:threonine dehydratase